jgi:rfaE bifunctional protein nucleotidyltransferase chain/domain
MRQAHAITGIGQWYVFGELHQGIPADFEIATELRCSRVAFCFSFRHLGRPSRKSVKGQLRLTHNLKISGERMSGKIVELEELSDRCETLRSAGKKIVATNGCFDLLHVGHVRYLQAARALGDLLIVGLNGDRSVHELKGGGRPITTQSDRAEILAALACVDLVTIFPEIRASKFLAIARPAVYVKGGDYTTGTLDQEERAILKEIGAAIRLVPFEAGYSTSGLIEQICKNKSGQTK